MEADFFTNQSESVGFLSIVGNLDTEILSNLLKLNWKKTTVQNTPIVFTVFDDPFARWTRLVCSEYQKTEYNNNGLYEDDFIDFLMYNQICCKKFTALQKQIFESSKAISRAKKIYNFKLNNQLGYMLNHFLHDHNVSNQFNNSLQVDYSTISNISKLKNLLADDINKPYLNKVMNYLSDDYNFINSIEFYAR
jgi:hypothetical protein